MTDLERQRLTRDVQQAEGFRAKAYRDSEGVWTIGWGTNLQELVVDAALATTWLERGIARAEQEAQVFAWFAGLSEARQAVIVELLYQLGLPRFSSFVKMILALERGDVNTAADELLKSRYAVQVPTRARRLAVQLRTDIWSEP